MGVSIEEYRQRIGCFAGVVTILSSCRVGSNNSNTCRKQSKHSRTALTVFIRLGCLVVFVAVIFQSSLFVLDLTQFGDVEINPGPNSARNYPFYHVNAETFEDLATTVLSEKYKIPFLKFKSGKDGGRDAVAKRTNIDLGGGNLLTDQNVVVQVKHTINESEMFNEATRKRRFDNEKKKVEKLVNENELDIYIIVTNYKLPAGQCRKLEETFKQCGAKEVVVVGNETLTQWLNDSQELQRKVLRQYFSSPSTDYLDVAMGDDDITGIVNMADEGRHPMGGIEMSIGIGTASFKLKIDGVLAIGTLGLAAYYVSSPEATATIGSVLSKVLETCGDKIMSIITRCLVVELHCHSPESFLQFLDDYELGKVEKRLSEEFSKIGIKKVTVGIENKKEVLRRREVIRRVRSLKQLEAPMEMGESSMEIENRLNMDVEMGDIENQCGQSTADNEDDITALKEILSDEYKYRASHLHPLPWFDTTQFELDKIYTKLGIIQRDSKRSKLTKKTVELSDIFDDHEDKSIEPRTILIEGSPGMGKTTLSLKIAHDWAMGKMPEKFPLIELVFLIKCRDMKCDILEAINDQLLSDEDSLNKKLSKIMKEKKDKILLIVDGLDETPEAAEEHVMKLLSRKYLKKCYVVATSRQEKGLEVRKYFDTLLEIKGYSEDDIELYIKRYFGDPLDIPEELDLAEEELDLAEEELDLAEEELDFAEEELDPSDEELDLASDRLIDKLKDDSRLKTLATNPLNTVLLCVVFEDYDGQLPSTVTELYDNIVFCITKRYRAKHNLVVEDKRFETNKETLGKLAYEGLLEDSLSFPESDLNVDRINCTEMGFVYKEVSRRKIEPDHSYWFLHKTFQEYLAAFYFTNTFKTVDTMVEKLKDTAKFMQVLMFVSGMLRKEKDAAQCRNFVQKLGTVLLQSMDKNRLLSVLCAVLSESFVDEDMARIMYEFLPEHVLANSAETLYPQYIARILPGILNLLCTKDGVDQEVRFGRLYFSNIKISTSDLVLICKALKGKLEAVGLTFESCQINNKAAAVLADMVSHNNTLEELHIIDNNLNEEGAQILAKGLGQNTTLKKLYLHENNLGDAGVKAIAAVLTQDTSFMDMAACNNDDGDKGGSALHSLNISSNNCGEDGASAVANILRTNNTLTELDIEDNPLGSGGVSCVAKALKLNKTLKSISLAMTECGIDGVVDIADMLHSNQTLTKLDLHNDVAYGKLNNKIGKDGAVALAAALKVNKSLKELHLGNNDITNEGLGCLIKDLEENTTLDKLCIKYPGDGSRRNKNDEPLKKKRRTKERITRNCDCWYS